MTQQELEERLGRKEAGKYTSRLAFQKGSCRAYHVAWKNGWLNDYFEKKVKK